MGWPERSREQLVGGTKNTSNSSLTIICSSYKRFKIIITISRRIGRMDLFIKEKEM